MSDAADPPEVDPPRLSDAPGSDLLRHALDGARADVPRASAIEAMLARFPVGPPGGPSGPSGPSGPTTGPPPGAAPIPAAGVGGGMAKIAGWILLAGAVGAGGYWATTQSARPPSSASPQTSSQAVTMPSSSPEASPSAALSVAAPQPSASTAPTVASKPLSQPSVSASAEVGGPSEIELLREAQAALSSNPGHALELANQHQARFPKGGLGQERDMIRIQALLAMGQKDQARALADDFRRRHPDSAHTSRLDDLFPR